MSESRSFRYHELDVFASGVLTGNPLAVVHDAADVDADTMLALTRWTNFSEATFLGAPTDSAADYAVRIFFPGGELPFAGHPTLGSCAAWLAAGGVPGNPDEIVQECPAGLIRIQRRVFDDGSTELAFAAPPLVRSGPVDSAERDRVIELFSLDPADVIDMQWADNGPGWMLVVLRSAEAVLGVSAPPVNDGGHADIGFVGLCGEHSAESAAGIDLEVRGFFPDQHGAFREDPVTGSLNASTAQVLLAAGLIEAPYVARQGTMIGSSGRISVSVGPDSTGAEQVWIGGTSPIVVEGTVTL